MTPAAQPLPRRSLLLLFVLALALRLLTVALVEADDYLAGAKADSAYFIRWAQSINEQSFWGKRLFVQSPLYPYLLAGVMRVSPQPLFVMRLLQALLSAASVVLLALAAHRLAGDRRATMATGFAAAIYGPFLYYATLILKETLGLFLLCLHLLLTLEAAERGRRRWWLASGLVLGLFWLVRANAPLLALPVLLLLVWPRGAQPWPTWSQRAAHTAAFLAGLLLAVAPLTLRNVLITGETALTLASGGSNFYVGNNPHATGLYYTLPGVSGNPALEASDLVEAAERMAGRPLSDAQASDYFVQQALRYIAAQPMDWLRLMFLKTLIYWNAFEIPDNYDLSFFKAQLPHLRFLPSFWMLASVGLAGLLLPARGLRFVSLARWETLVYMGSVVLFYVNSRFRVVGLPFLFLGLTLSVRELLDAAAQRSLWRLARLLVLGAAAFALTQTSVCDSERARVSAFSWSRYGAHLLEHGRLAEAREALVRAYGFSAADAYANHGLGELAALERDWRLAAQHWLEALRRGAEDPEIYRKISSALVAAGQRQQAIDFLVLAAKNEPDKPQPPQLLRALGYPEDQLRELRPP